MIGLPKIRNEINPKDVHIDRTPNGCYAVRILEYYRLKCNEKWIVEGVKEGEELIYNVMNDAQDKRAVELDKAIAKLLKDDI